MVSLRSKVSLQRWKSTIIGLLFLGSMGPMLGQNETNPKQLRKIEDHVYLFQGGGNWALTSLVLEDDDGLILVDTHFSDKNNELLILGIKAQFPDKKVKTLVISHPHADHFMGTYLFERAFGNIEVIGIKGEKEHMQQTAKILYKAYQEVAPEPKVKLDNIVYPTKEIEGDFEISFSGRVAKFEMIDQNESWKSWVLYLPDSSLLYLGDLYWGGLTLDSNGFGSSLIGWEKELRKVMNRKTGIVIPGHGIGVYDRKTVYDFLYLMDNFITKSKEKIQNGMTQEEYVKAQFHKNLEFFGGREVNLKRAYNELKGILK